jgi:hypothetical protein
MQNTTVWALLLAPLLTPIYRYVFLLPGRKAHDWIWKNVPEGRLRRLLLKKV